MTNQFFMIDTSIGATDKLSLRVSIATLVRVLFEHPRTGERMLALDRRATLHPGAAGNVVEVKSQPFGGAIRIHDIGPLQNLIGTFHFDSEESRAEQDFRLFIRPSTWKQVREFCLEHFKDEHSAVLECYPHRELHEEFAEALGFPLTSDQYICQAVGTILEEAPSPTDNFYARGYPTVRMYRIFEARILDPAPARALLINSDRNSNENLRDLALEDAHKGGQGWASAALILSFHQLNNFYQTILPHTRNQPVSFHGHQLDETVTAILKNVTAPKYQRA